ncbi:metallophosphoesterase [Geotoga petraea]|uniref:Putative phosphoesterase n=1 Tax=Geotoga petraea TaxID=28234 RepID=A0A1G6KSU0_9BACT|nr:metallophosphoesterase [Geotoga petraea]SDC34140.1 putative phosphoesterase [Geotoga petraea]
MKISILSDIHVDKQFVESDPIEDALIKVLNEEKPDYLIIAGDIADDYRKSLEILYFLEKNTKTKILFVPGNHDLWSKENGIENTNEIYLKMKEFKGNLSNGPVIIGNWAIVGDVGWYDYSFAHEKYSLEQLSAGNDFNRHWQDKKYVNWQKDDISVTNEFKEKLNQQIDDLKDKNIILVTHVVTHEKFTVKNRDMWEYFNAYLGTKNYDDLYKKENVKYVIMGHVHYRKKIKEDGTIFICNCLNYRNQWFYSKDAYTEIKKALKTIKI